MKSVATVAVASTARESRSTSERFAVDSAAKSDSPSQSSYHLSKSGLGGSEKSNISAADDSVNGKASKFYTSTSSSKKKNKGKKKDNVTATALDSNKKKQEDEELEKLISMYLPSGNIVSASLTRSTLSLDKYQEQDKEFYQNADNLKRSSNTSLDQKSGVLRRKELKHKVRGLALRKCTDFQRREV